MLHKVTATKLETTAFIKGKIETKTLYYLTIGEGDNLLQINVGEKTYEAVQKINTETKPKKDGK